jgi:hypothetical protein
MTDRIMKKLLMASVLFAGIFSSCTNNLDTNVNTGKDILSGDSFNLSPLDISVEIYTNFERESSLTPEGCIVTLKGESSGLYYYDITIGPNLSDDKRAFEVQFNGYNVKINQEKAELSAEEPKTITFTDTNPKYVEYKANFPCRAELSGDDPLSFTYSYVEEQGKFEISLADFVVGPKKAVLTICPDLPENETYAGFVEKFKREYQLDLPAPPAPPVSVPGSVVLNELSGSDKYIELYNTTDKEISLEGFMLVKYDSTKEDGKSTTWTGAKGMKIAAKGYVVLESSDLSDEAEGGDPNYAYESANHVFAGGLSGKKNVKIELLDASGKVIDTFIRGEEGEGWNQVSGFNNDKNHSFSRVPNGTGPWVYATPTKGQQNPTEKAGDIEQQPEM